MLVNFTSGVFKSEKEMELYQFRWAQVREKSLPLLREQGLVRYAGMQIWNKHGKTQMGIDPDPIGPGLTQSFGACLYHFFG